MELPTGAEAADLLRRCGVAEIDVDGVLASSPARNPELMRLLVRCHDELVADMGGLGTLEGWPALPDSLGAVGRYFYVWVLLSVIPQVREYHASRGIPEDATWDILGELGSQMANRRSVWGEGGLHTYHWMTVHFRGVLYRTGRLLFERLRIWFDADGEHAPRKGDWALGVHIPRGRLTPEACADSFALAREFFARHYPDEPYRYATCVSWVLDPQLEEYLPADSNIIRFGRRFQLLPIGSTPPDDRSTVESIFARRYVDLDRLPQTTRLERAVVTHLRAGQHWYYRTGWLTFPPT